MITKKELFNIQKKYLELLKWFQDNSFGGCDTGFHNKDYLFKRHENGELFMYPRVEISRGFDFIEMGSPTQKDLELFKFSVDFSFSIRGNQETMKKWHFFIGKHYDDNSKLPKVFNNCYFDKYSDNNEVKISDSSQIYHGWSMFEREYENKPKYYSDGSCVKELSFYIPITITYTFNELTIKQL